MRRRQGYKRMQSGGDTTNVKSIGKPPISDFLQNKQGQQGPKDAKLERTSLDQQSNLNNQQQIIQQLQIQNQKLESHNKLLQTQIELQKKIDSARKVNKTKDPGPKKSPKKKGGQKDRLIVLSSGNFMRRGGAKK